MRDFKDVKKRVLAFLMCMLIVGSTAGSDLFVLATEENNCTEYVDEHTYAGSILSPEGSSDGHCDTCGQVAESHSEEALAAAEESASEEASSTIEETATEATTETTTGTTAEATTDATETTDDTTATDAETTEESTDTTTEETPASTEDTTTSETTPDNIEETCTHVDEDGDGVCDLCGETIEKAETEEEEECEHEWEYVDNGDGTHTKTCALCGESVTEDCEYDENGVCIHCGHEKECEHEWEYVENGDGTHTKTCALCGESVTEDCEYDENGVCIHCGYQKLVLEYQTFSKTFHGVTVTVAGRIPKGGNVTIDSVSVARAETIVNDNLEEKSFSAYEAFDINIYDASGNKFQPEEHGETVQVTFAGIDELTGADQDDVQVYRIENSSEITEMEKEVVGEDVYFEAEHFTTYVLGTSDTTYSNYVALAKYQNFATIGTASTTYTYTKVVRADFYVYVTSSDIDDGDTYTFTATAYKNLTDTTDPTSGTVVGTGSESLTAASEGWVEVEITLTCVDDCYVLSGNTYSIVVASDSAVNVGYGTGSAATYIKSSSGTWASNSTYKGIFDITTNVSDSDDYTLEVSNTVSDEYTISSVTAEDGTATSSGVYYYAKGDEDTFTATLSTDVERSITWTSSNTSVLTIGSSTGVMSAVGAGTATITATYTRSDATTSTYSVSVTVLGITIGGTDTYGSNVYSTSYTGSEIKPTVVVSDGTNTLTVTTTYSNNTDVTTTALASIAYAADSSTTYTFKKYFTITALTLTEDVFTDAVVTISSGEITAITGLNSITSGDVEVTPVFETDFTAEIYSTSSTSAGIEYTITATGIDNFTGTVNFTYTKTGTDISEVVTVELSSSSALKSVYYSGSAVTLTEDSSTGGWSEVTFYNTDGEEVTDIVTSDTAAYSINTYGSTDGDATSAGTKTITFTMDESASGYTGTLTVNFTIQQAYMSDCSIVWLDEDGNATTDTVGTKTHTGSAITLTAGSSLTAGVDFVVYLDNYIVSTDEYTISYSGDHTSIGTATFVLTGNNENLDTSTLTGYFKIEADYSIDMIVRINDSGTYYDGTYSNSYATGYSRYYDTTTDTPTVIIYLNGALTSGTDYSLAYYDDEDCTTALTADAGTKYIKVTGLNDYADEDAVVASYTVAPRPLSNSKITKTIGTSITETFTGEEITLTTATSTSESADIKLVYSTTSTILTEGTDYYITYSDNYNVGTATYTITGQGNYTGTLSGSKYKFTIEAAELVTAVSSSTAVEALAALATTTYTYDGTAKEPDVTVTIGDTTIEQYDSNNNSAANYTITYANNTAVGTATATITGSNNLTGSVVLSFTISSDTVSFGSILVAGTSSTYISESVSDGVYTRIWTNSLTTYYTGSKYSGSVSVYDSSGNELTEDTDYSVDYVNSVKAAEYTTSYDTSSEPYIEITGLGTYANNNALVFYTILPRAITSTTITETDDYAKSYTGSAVTLDLTITYGSKTLTKGTDYTVAYYSDEDCTTELTDYTSSGTYYVKISGTGNYDSSVVKSYTVGTSISDATVYLYNNYSGESWSDSKDSSGNYMAYWRPSDTSGTSAAVCLKLTADSTTLTADSDYTVVEATTDATSVSYDAGNTNTFTVTGAGGYYGSTTISYYINPVDISKVSLTTDSSNDSDQEYTGAEIEANPVMYFKTTSASDSTAYISYTLVEGTDYSLDPDTLGTDIASSITVTVTGEGNFDSTKTLTYNIVQGYVNVYLYSTTNSVDTLLGTTSSATTEYDTDTDVFAYYYGGTYVPSITIKDTSETNTLTENTDYTLTYDSTATTTAPTSAGEHYATITIGGTGNFVAQVITINYTIQQKELTDTTITFADVTYKAAQYSASDIKAIVDGDSSLLSVAFSDGTELTYGTDYEILTSTTDDITSIIGDNDVPSTASDKTNYFYIAGEGEYSGYVQVYFGIILDISSSYANVTINDAYYELSSTGVATIVPLITYRSVDATSGYDETLTWDSTDAYGNDASAGDDVTVTRDNAGSPGPDDSITITGNATSGAAGNTAVCTGTVSDVTYYNSSSATSETVYFIVDLSTYTGISISSSSIFPYSGEYITVSFSGLGDAVYSSDLDVYDGDYTVYYTQSTSATGTTSGAKEVGTWYAVITAADDSQYFKAGTNSGTLYSFQVKYNLSTATMVFYNSSGTAVTSTSYTGNKISMQTNDTSETISSDIYGGIRTQIYCIDTDHVVYDYVDGVTSYVSISPIYVKTIGSHTITASIADSDLVMGSLTGTFKVTGLDISDSSVAKVSLDSTSYDYMATEIEPEVTVTLVSTSTVLTEGTDYSVTYGNNVNAGTGYVYITGLNSYECDEFEAATFTINAISLADSHISVVVDDTTYSGYWLDPTTVSSGLVELKPDYAVYYVDDDGNKYELEEETDSVTGDYKVSGWEYNTRSSTMASADSETPALIITAGSSGNITANTTNTGTFTINQLNLNSSDVTLGDMTAEYTGEYIDISELIEITTTTPDGDTVTLVSNTVADSDGIDNDDWTGDYTVTVSGGTNVSGTKVCDMGTYTVKVTGMENCTSARTFTFTITERSLADNWHYYYSDSLGWQGDWTAFTTTSNDTVVSGYTSTHTTVVDSLGEDTLDITIYDVIDYTSGTTVTPTVVIVDNITDSDGNVTQYTLVEGTDYSVSLTNNDETGTAEWSKTIYSNSDNDYHASPTTDSPAITITGINNYTDSITLPFNIGLNISSLLSAGDLTATYTVYNSYMNSSGKVVEQTASPYSHGVTFSYEYNGYAQTPTPKLVYDSTTLVKGTDYTVTIVDENEEEDDSITAGTKYIVITGAGSYCGTISQEYTITRKEVTASTTTFTNSTSDWTATDTDGEEQYTFEITSSDVSRLDEDTAKTYFGDDYEDYVNYYYAVYDGDSIEPEISVDDNMLGPYRNKTKTIDESDLDVTYTNCDSAGLTATTDSSTGDATGYYTVSTYAQIAIAFKASDDTTSTNYYATSSGSATYYINFIIVVCDISSDFDVSFSNGSDGPSYDFDGTAMEPEMVVTDGTLTLTENTDYTVAYEDNILPGTATVTVTGTGNYSGSVEKTFTIWGNLGSDVTICYLDDSGNYVEGQVAQQYTGEAIDPDVYLVIEETSDMQDADISEDKRVLTYEARNDGDTSSDDYVLTSTSSTDDYVTNGTVVYTGNPSEYWKGTLSITYDIEFDESEVEVLGYEEEYTYTGLEIKPSFYLSVSTAEITSITYYRNGSETDDFINVGTITAEIEYTVENVEISNPVTAEYEIVALEIGDCTIIYANTMRYTGYQVKPAVVVYYENDDGIVTLTKDTDYSLTYGSNIYGTGKITLAGLTDNITSSTVKTFTIALGAPVSLKCSEVGSTSLTFTWVHDIYTDGEELVLYEVDSSDNSETQVATGTVSGSKGTYTFSGLNSVTTYKVAVRSYATISTGKEYSSYKYVSSITDISSTSITVTSTSTGKATVSWDTSGDIVIYKIYRCDSDDDDDTGTKVAIYPASVGSYTNSSLTSGATYYYYVEGYIVVSGVLTLAVTSDKVAVTIL